MTTRIIAPSAGYSGHVGGVKFNSGVAETDNDQVIAYCERAGYLIEDLGDQESDEERKAREDEAAETARVEAEKLAAKGKPPADTKKLVNK